MGICTLGLDFIITVFFFFFLYYSVYNSLTIAENHVQYHIAANQQSSFVCLTTL